MSFRTLFTRLRDWIRRQFDLHPSAAYERYEPEPLPPAPPPAPPPSQP